MSFNPYIQKNEKLKDANHYFKRKDEFPHPLRRVMYHLNRSINKPIEKVVYEVKSEAEFWRDSHIDSLKEGEWFKSPQEALDARNANLKTAKEAKAKVDADIAKTTKAK